MPATSQLKRQASGCAAAVPRELQCGYRSKVCTSVRATKLDGTLHKLCEFHRLKANSSQRRLQKRRQLRKLEEATSGHGDQQARESDSEDSVKSADGVASRPTKRARLAGTSSPTTADDSSLLLGGSMPYEFNPSEVAILEQTLFSSSSMSSVMDETTARMPAPMGLFDMDVIVADVLREFTGPVTMPALDASGSWCWTV
jgi:hypothetical protein